jgi:hypothetical protein
VRSVERTALRNLMYNFPMPGYCRRASGKKIMNFLFTRKYSRIVLALCIIFSIGACVKEPESTSHNFALVDLLITRDDMPAGWRIDFPAGKFSDSYYAEEAVTIVFVPETGDRRATGHDIYRFSSSEVARFKLHNEFIPEVINSGEFVPEGWAHPNLSADENKFVCYWKAVDGNPEKFMLCKWTARYDEFIVFFVSWVLPDLMSLDKIEDLIVEIDRKIAEPIGK